MPNKLTPSPSELTSSNWLVFISGGSILKRRVSTSNSGPVVPYMRWMASKMIKIDIKMRNMPFAKPESVSMRP